MVLIADSGATKTDWVVLDTGTGHRQIATQGIHPLFQTEDDMARIVATELLPALGAGPVDELHFYGAGCLPHTLPTVERALRRHLTVTGTVEVCSDLLAAARALCAPAPTPATTTAGASLPTSPRWASSWATRAAAPAWANGW